MLTADNIQDMGEYLNYAFETMHDVKYWMPLPNVECHPYHGEIVK